MIQALQKLVEVHGSFDKELQYANFAHNLFLSSLSSALVTAIVISLYAEYVKADGGFSGIMRIFCDEKPHKLAKGRLIAFFYVNYLTKVRCATRIGTPRRLYMLLAAQRCIAHDAA